MDFFSRFHWRANDAAFKLMRTHGSPLPPPLPAAFRSPLLSGLTIINSGPGNDPIDAKRTDSRVRGASLISPIARRRRSVYPTSSRGQVHQLAAAAAAPKFRRSTVKFTNAYLAAPTRGATINMQCKPMPRAQLNCSADECRPGLF